MKCEKTISIEARPNVLDNGKFNFLGCQKCFFKKTMCNNVFFARPWLFHCKKSIVFIVCEKCLQVVSLLERVISKDIP